MRITDKTIFYPDTMKTRQSNKRMYSGGIRELMRQKLYITQCPRAGHPL